jgi:YidC/Oxa1 family membrane protein insertase
MRNQLIAIVLMTVLFVAWFKWFAPAPHPKPPPGSPQAAPSQEARVQPATSPEQGKAQPETPQTWPGLPEVPTITDPAAEEVTLGNDSLELVFSRIGGRLKRALVLPTKGGGSAVQLVPPDTLPDTEAVYPLGLRFTEEGLGDALDRRRFDVERDPSGKAVIFSLCVPDTAIIRKRFWLDDQKCILHAQVAYENLKPQPQILGMDQTPAYYLNWGPNVSSGDEKMGVKQALVWYKGGREDELATASMSPASDATPFTKTVAGSDWVGIKSAYFVVAFKPEFSGSQAWVKGNPKRFRFGLSAPRFEAQPHAIQSHGFTIYLGPSEHQVLAQGWETLPAVLRFFTPRWSFMDWFAKLLLRILNGFYAYIPNYGLAIIFLTIVVRVTMYPLTLKSMKSMKKMQLLGPHLEELKAKYSDNPQEMNKRMMELYKERGVNPLGGCLPMFLQMPVFIALYRMLWSAYELRGAPFMLWMTDLSQPDRLLHMPWMLQVPFVGVTLEYLNLLPILMGVSMVFSQKMMPAGGAMQNQQQKVMMTVMPVFFSFICYSMASGLNLYILTSTVLGMVQQKFTRVGDMELKPKKTVGKRQHFYTAAQARKRQLTRQAKLEKSKKTMELYKERGANTPGGGPQAFPEIPVFSAWFRRLQQLMRGGADPKDR